MEQKADRFLDAMSRLIESTQDGEIEWVPQTMEEEPFKRSPDDQIGPIFMTIYKGKPLMIYLRRSKYKPSALESGVTDFFRRAIGSPETGTWYTEVLLSIVDDRGVALWTFPKHRILKDLFEAIQYQASGAKDFLEDILSEE